MSPVPPERPSAARRNDGLLALASARADAAAPRGTDEWWRTVFSEVRNLDGIDGRFTHTPLGIVDDLQESR